MTLCIFHPRGAINGGIARITKILIKIIMFRRNICYKELHHIGLDYRQTS
jgi:hypothetical protein